MIGTRSCANLSSGHLKGDQRMKTYKELGITKKEYNAAIKVRDGLREGTYVHVKYDDYGYLREKQALLEVLWKGHDALRSIARYQVEQGLKTLEHS